MAHDDQCCDARLARRRFLALGAGLASTLLFDFDARAADGGDQAPTLVCIFMRGGVDGLNVVVPYTDVTYRRERPGLALGEPGKPDGVLDLDGRFGLHPRLAPLAPLFSARELAVVHAVGSPHPTRSHFEAQDYMESGAPGGHVRDGWLARALGETGAAAASRFSAISYGEHVPRALYGRKGVVSVSSLKELDLRLPGAKKTQFGSALAALYAEGDGAAVRAGREALAAMNELKKLDLESRAPDNGAEYPRSAAALREIAGLIKSNVGVRVAFIDVGGWDTHVGQGKSDGRLGRALDELGRALAAFRRDLGDRFEHVVVLTMSEFGRTIAENGSGGTDHGHATAMFVAGGRVKGGRVYGRFPGLEPEQRFERRDLAVTTDFRDLFAEIAARHLGASPLDRVFPGYRPNADRFLGLLG